MNKIQELKKIEIGVLSLLEETNEILIKNYPLDSRTFLSEEEKKKVERNDSLVHVLDLGYKNLYNTLTEEEKNSYEYKNLKLFYENSTFQPKGLITINSNSTISEIEDAFNKAKFIAIDALDQIHYGEEIYDMNIVNNNTRIFNACKNVLSSHELGEAYIASLERYKNRIESNRTVDDDVLDYIMLVKRTKELSYQYAKSILNGINDDQKTVFENKYKQIFEQERKLIEFMPANVLKEIFENLSWYKLESEKNPLNIIKEKDENDAKVKVLK